METEDIMASLENADQLLLQHLRTAGLKSTKEGTLIEEVLESRKLRRKVINSYENKVKQLNSQLKSQEEKVHEVQETLQRRDEELRSLTTTLTSTHDYQLKNLESLLRKEMSETVDSIKKSSRKEMEKVRIKYEEQLQQVDLKLQELMEEKKSNDFVQAKEMANNIAQRIAQEYEAKYQKKVAEYVN